MNPRERRANEDQLAALELLLRAHERRHEVLDIVWASSNQYEAGERLRDLWASTTGHPLAQSSTYSCHDSHASHANVAFGFDGDSDYDVSEFSTNDRGIVARLCVDDTEQDIYMVTRKTITYLGERDCSTDSRQSASVVLDSVRGEIIRGEERMPSAAAEFEQGS